MSTVAGSTAVPPRPRRERPALGVGAALSWSATSFVGSAVLAVATSAPLARLLAPDDFGLVAFAMVVLGVVYVVQDLGLSPALVQHRGDAGDAAVGVLWVHLAVGVLLVGAVAAAGRWVTAALGMPAVAPVLLALAPTVLLRAAGLVPRALLQRRLAFRALAAADLSAFLVRAAVAI